MRPTGSSTPTPHAPGARPSSTTPGPRTRAGGADVVVRRAIPADAPAIARVHLAAWREAYREILDDEALAARTLQGRLEFWEAHLRAPPRGHRTLVAIDDGGAVRGFAGVSPSRDDDADRATTGELTVIYVTPEHVGRGVGRALIGAAEAELANAGFPRATLWVYSGNARARRFYEAAGWRAIGPERGHPAREVRYGKMLRP